MICPNCGDECEHMVDYNKLDNKEWEYCWNCDLEFEAEDYRGDYNSYEEIYGD